MLKCIHKGRVYMVFDFKEISNEELNMYMESVLSGEEEYQNHKKHEEIKSYYSQKVENAEKRFHKVESGFVTIKKYIQEERYEDSYNKCITLSNSIMRLAQDLRVLPSQYGCSNELTSLTVADDSYPVHFDYSDDKILHIILPDILPHRIKINDDKHIAMQDYSYNKQCLYNAFAKEFEYGRFKVYDKKVVLYFENIYTDPKFFIDNDNVDTKIITDIIASYMLIDDNPFWCSHYIDAVIGEYNHTEVYVVPQGEFIDFIKERNEKRNGTGL